ncbi:MAG: hypothetical protein V5804_09400 [Mucilaginibacter sp.]|uniref:hypothetical protein n=1 Tax=Mucilaginibacter sp. TaxID=1882438 RepID=UPI0034E57811
MTTLSIKIPEGKESDLSSYVKKIGGEVIADKKKLTKDIEAEPSEDEVTHESFFGENIKRAIRAFKS